VHPVYARLHKLNAATFKQVYDTLQNQAQAWTAEQSIGSDVGPFRTSYTAEMRYEGQGYDVPVVLEADWLANGDRRAIEAAFHAAHRGVYGHASEGNEVWLKELRVHLSGPIPRPRVRAITDHVAQPTTTRLVRLFGRSIETTVIDRAMIAAGDVLKGPAIVNQMDTTTLIPQGWQASVAPSGALVLRHTEASA